MAKRKKKNWDLAANVLLVVGGLNWGLIGLFKMNVVNMLLGTVPWLEQVVYVLVGLSALYVGYGMTK